jgi:hypothetical protein
VVEQEGITDSSISRNVCFGSLFRANGGFYRESQREMVYWLVCGL